MIVSVKRISSFIVETDEEEYSCYRRGTGPDTWQNLMGESWEYVDVPELEAEFQREGFGHLEARDELQ